MVYTVVGWNDNDLTDHRAAGWWLRFPGRYPFRRGPSLLESEGNTFINGSEPDISTPPRLPDAGQVARVDGAGVLPGPVRQRLDGLEAPVDVEELTGTIIITADLSDQTARGCIGCGCVMR